MDDVLQRLLPNSYEDYKGKQYILFTPPSVQFMKNRINQSHENEFIYENLTYTIKKGYYNYDFDGIYAFNSDGEKITFEYNFNNTIYWVTMDFKKHQFTQIRQPYNRGVGTKRYIEDGDQLIAFY